MLYIASNNADPKLDCFAILREYNRIPGMSFAINGEFDVSAAKPLRIFDFH